MREVIVALDQAGMLFLFIGTVVALFVVWLFIDRDD